jgi:hypothetical protein
MSTQGGGNLARYFSVAFFVFAATTYLVFSLDMLMVPEDEAVTMMPRRRMEQEDDLEINPRNSKYLLRTNSPEEVDDNNNNDNSLLVVEEEDLETFTLERDHADSDARFQQRASSVVTEHTSDDDFADGLNSIGLAMMEQQQLTRSQQQQAVTDRQAPSSSSSTTGLINENPLISKVPFDDSLTGNSNNVAGDEMDEPPQPDDDEDDEDDDVATTTTKPTSLDSSTPATVPSSEWRRIHTCKYGRSEKSPTLAYGTWIWRHKKGAALHDDYVKTPTDSKLKHLKSAIQLLSDNVLDVKSVTSAAAEAGYTLCKIELETSVVIAWQPRLKGDALFFTRHAVQSSNDEDQHQATINPLIIEVPHALYDHTLHQGLHVFSETRAKALILSESHRCSRSLTNKCTGNEGEPIRNLCSSSTSSSTTSSRNVYHNSDAAHAVQTTFHAIHEQLMEDNPKSLVVSLHATKADDFVVSDGTSNSVDQTPSAPVVLFARQLANNLPAAKVNLCNEYQSLSSFGLGNLISVTEDKRHICGATNVQGRHMNGATDACRAKVHRNGEELTSSGRFLHIEEPVQLVLPLDSKSTKPAMSKPLSEALLVALQGL